MKLLVDATVLAAELSDLREKARGTELYAVFGLLCDAICKSAVQVGVNRKYEVVLIPEPMQESMRLLDGSNFVKDQPVAMVEAPPPPVPAAPVAEEAVVAVPSANGKVIELVSAGEVAGIVISRIHPGLSYLLTTGKANFNGGVHCASPQLEQEFRDLAALGGYRVVQREPQHVTA